MKIYFECKKCHRGFEDELDDTGLSCPGCGSSVGLGPLLTGLSTLVDAMANIRGQFRFEVLLESDDLPEPHGFDVDYELPEGDAATLANELAEEAGETDLPEADLPEADI